MALFLVFVAVLIAVAVGLLTPSAGPTMLVPALATLLMLFVVTRDGLRPRGPAQRSALWRPSGTRTAHDAAPRTTCRPV